MTPPMKTASASMSLMAGLLALSRLDCISGTWPHPRARSNVHGPFGRNANHAGLVKAFGNNNVVYQDIDGAGGEKIKASVLYPDDPKARLQFLWRDQNGPARPDDQGRRINRHAVERQRHPHRARRLPRSKR